MNHLGVEIEKLGNMPANADKSPQYLIVRLLLGTVAIRHAGTTVEQRVDYSELPQIPQTLRPSVAVKDYLASYGIGGSVKRFIQVTIPDNRRFFTEVLSEFLHYFLQGKRGCHTAAFVHLYRILERISYSVPLLYASTQKDYYSTFSDFKNLFDTQSASGELGLFKKFLRQGRFIDPIKLAVKYDISLVSPSGNQSRYFNTLKTIYSDFDLEDATLHKFELEFQKVIELLIVLRNRFFHTRTGDGQRNIGLGDVRDPDEFFGCINPVFANFLALLILQAISCSYKT